ncbi:4Fe-4S binding protein [Desulfuribacillus alkaliarsenatis]|uniref:FMN-binding domain-containing protein n=1 Tax=Desulfuribacillus alkaliarsenatis TaxID=766136 RepID=A0A1E5G4I8_9FIRM|nr:4Fe-4S binding protein [Desulfuribacillus alkaliarsenatis]OEF98006.1 hypothetical protein BHF68_13160 [Desulfuribacillus alkaliarsenatis]
MACTCRNQASRAISIQTVLWTLALITLFMALLYGYNNDPFQHELELRNAYPDIYHLTEVNVNPIIFEATDIDNNSLGFISIVQAQGYGGPVTVATFIDYEGTIESVRIINHKEDFPFLIRIENADFYKFFVNQNVVEVLNPNYQIDGVTGATISANAIARAALQGSYGIGDRMLSLEVSMPNSEWRIQPTEWMFIALYLIVILCILKKYTKPRFLILLASMILLGFYLNGAITISNFVTISLGYIPSFMDRLIWWLVVVGTALLTIILGKNIYCAWLCPFAGLQELLAKIGGGGIRISANVKKYADPIKYLLTWLALILALATSNPAIAGYEPFAAIFGFQAIGVQWLILFIIIFISMFIVRPWCQFFCPVGVVLTTFSKIRLSLSKQIRRLPAWEDRSKQETL